jgi:hypothetical protein
MKIGLEGEIKMQSPGLTSLMPTSLLTKASVLKRKRE